MRFLMLAVTAFALAFVAAPTSSHKGAVQVAGGDPIPVCPAVHCSPTGNGNGSSGNGSVRQGQ